MLGIIEQRCLVGRNGAEWFARRMHARVATSTATTRCGRTLEEYREQMHTNEPVHTWE